MEKQLAEIYKALANKLDSIIPVDWNKIYYLGEVEKEQLSWSSIMYFEVENSNEIVRSHSIPEKHDVSDEIYDDLMSEVNDFLLELYECFQENGQESWEQVSIVLSSNGKFDVEYLYDTMSSIEHSQLEREVIWAYDTFQYIPQDEYSKRILDEHLLDR